MYVISNEQMGFILRILGVVIRLPKGTVPGDTRRMCVRIAGRLARKRPVEYSRLKGYEK